MPRSLLRMARIEANLTQHGLAKLVGTTRSTVSRWERDRQSISAYFREKLLKKLNYTDELLADLDAQEPDDTHEKQDSQPSQVDVTMDSSVTIDVPTTEEEEELNRRTFNKIAGLGGLALVSNVSIISGPVIAPELNLQAAKTNVRLAWNAFNRGQYSDVQALLSDHMPILEQLSTTVWTRQKEAATFGVQGSIMQLLLSTRKMDFEGRIHHSQQALRFAQLSGNRDLIATALDWYGNTYTVCYQRPDESIPLLNTALSVMTSDSSPLVRSAICINLAIAHSQDKDESKKAENEILSLGYIEQATAVIPERPELDPVQQYILWDLQQLQSMTGRSYLHLAEHFPNGKYGQMAYDLLVVATSKQSVDQDVRIAVLTRQADAARTIGELRVFTDSLTEALPLLGSRRRVVGAIDVLGRVPEQWRKEDAVQQLQKDLNHALVVVQQ